MEPLYNGNFRTSHYLQQYRGFSLSEVKNVLVTTVGSKIFVLTYYGGFFYCVLNLEDLLREVPLCLVCEQHMYIFINKY